MKSTTTNDIKTGQILQNLGLSTMKSKGSPIQIIPESIEFHQIQTYLKYEMQLLMRNEGPDNQKIRVIGPSSQFFTLRIQANPFTLAPGLSSKITVYFSLDDVRESTRTIYEDRMYVIGQGFRKQVPLKATKFNFKIGVPKLFKLGMMLLGKDSKYQIPIENTGKQNVEITTIETSSPMITLADRKLMIKKQSQANLKISVQPTALGIIKQFIYLPNGKTIQLTGICSEENIEIYNKEGVKINAINLGEVFIGEKIVYQFFIANSTASIVEGLSKIFSSNCIEEGELKIDFTKMAFISRINPKNLIEEEKGLCFKCHKSKFEIEAFNDFENKITMVKIPTQQQIKQFCTEAINKIEPNNRLIALSYKSLPLSTQILYIKILNREQAIKIPINFTAIIPKIKLSQDKFQFKPTQPKNISKLNFVVKNRNQRRIIVDFGHADNFYFEGNTEIEGKSEQQFSICFRPLIIGQYSQHIKLTVFNTWSITLKTYGLCCPKILNLNKQNTHRTLTKSASSDCIKTARYYLQSERKRKLDICNTSYLKNKITQRSRMGYSKSPELPVDLEFDACENPKVYMDGNRGIKKMKSALVSSFDQEEKNIVDKRIMLPPASTRLTLKQIIRFSEELTPIELSNIQVKCDKIDFGTIYIGSLNQKQFVVMNNNNKVVIIQIDTRNISSLSQTKIQVKKILPFRSVKFLISFRPQQLGKVKVPFHYIINRHHIFEMDITSNITLVNLLFSTKYLKFVFTPNDPNFEKIENFVITNYGSTTTRFKIVPPGNKAFGVLGNKEQEILPNSEIHVDVKYCPGEGGKPGEKKVERDRMVVKVIGGAENEIICEGCVWQPKYSIKEKQINLPEMFISLISQRSLTFRNHTKHQTSIKLQLDPPNLSEVITLHQTNFILHSQQRKQIFFTIMSHQVRIVKGAFCIRARGGKISMVPIFINFCFPTVEVVGCEAINFGIVHVMTDRFEKEIVLLNKAKSEIKLQAGKIDEKDDYIISFIAAEQRIELALIKNEQTTNNEQLDNKTQSIFVQQNLLTSSQLHPKKLSKIITLLPSVETKFKIKFIPKSQKQYQINIPLFLYQAVREIQPILQKIICKAVQPPFFVQPYILIFDDVVISNSENTHQRQFEIINPHNKEVNWKIQQNTDPNSHLFRFDVTNGQLKPKESKQINVQFHPKIEGMYTLKFKLFSPEIQQIEVQLQINGNAFSPRLAFNKNVLILPVVPLKTESKGIIYLQNYGYQTVFINKAKFLNLFEGVQLKCQFIDGKFLSLAKKRIKLEVSFKSQLPVSLVTVLQVVNQFENKISIPVVVTADHCMLTSYPYFEMNNVKVVYDGEDNGYKLMVGKEINYTNKQMDSKWSSTVTGNFIKKWCNYELNINLPSFPKSLIQSRGELLYEIVVKMANGRPIIKRPLFTSQDKRAKMLELHTYYSNTITNLQSEGAFLNHIRPQHLLNMNDYLLYMFHNGFIIDEDQFEYLSHESWTILFYQLCRLYIENMINQKFITKLGRKEKQEISYQSIVYSENEVLMLRFMDGYLGEESIANFNDRERVLQVLQKIIEKTFKISLGEQITKIRNKLDNQMISEVVVGISNYIFNCLQEYGLAMYIEANDFLIMGHKEMILFFISLMQNLIHYQNSTVINFISEYGQKNQQVIQLENPSKKQILKYWVKVYGSNNFKTSQKQLEIEPKGKKLLKIMYQCKEYQNQEAELILIPVKGEMLYTNAHSLNFLLKNSLIAKTVIKKINIKVCLYSIKTVNLDVELPDKQQREYEVKVCSSEGLTDRFRYPNQYLIQGGHRNIKNGKDKCQIKIAPLQLGEISFRVVYISTTLQQYIYQFSINVLLPTSTQTFKLQSFTTEKQQTRSIKLPVQNLLKEQCLKFHREINREKQKKNIIKQGKVEYQLEFVDQSIFVVKEKIIRLGVEDKNQGSGNVVQFSGLFLKPYRQYKSNLLIKNEQLNDYRVYTITANVSIKTKIFHLTLQTKTRQTTKSIISISISPFTFRVSKSVPNFSIEQREGGQLLVAFSPRWATKEEVELYIQNVETFEQHIYKIKLEAVATDEIKEIAISCSNLFQVPFQIDLGFLRLSENEINLCRLRTDIKRKHEVNIQVDGQNKKIKGVLYPGIDQQLASIKLSQQKSDKYYEFLLNIKNIGVIELGNLLIEQSIGQIKKLVVKEIDPKAKNFYFQFESTNYFQYEIAECKQRSNFMIVFKPEKQINQMQQIKFRCNQKEYLLKVHLKANKLESLHVPVIMTENLQRKTGNILIHNHLQKDGVYSVEVGDQQRFKIEKNWIQIKGKDKFYIKVMFCPQYINENAKTTLILRSDTLPQLTYNIEGMSKLKYQQVYEEVESFEKTQAIKQIYFKNQFNQRLKFRFEILPNNSTYQFEGGGKDMIKDLQVGQDIRVMIKNRCICQEEKQQNQTKVLITKISNKQIVKEITLKLLVVRNLDDKKYQWHCRARQTIFQTMKLPIGYIFRELQTDPYLQKYITYSVDERQENEISLKFYPLKRIKDQQFNILLISDKIKFRVICHVNVSSAPIDDTILIRTSSVEEIGVSIFKLTNTAKQAAIFKAYFEKKYQELSVEPTNGLLEAYGKDGTAVTVKFVTQINNKRVEDKLIIETQSMEWIFKVIGIQEKVLDF